MGNLQRRINRLEALQGATLAAVQPSITDAQLARVYRRLEDLDAEGAFDDLWRVSEEGPAAVADYLAQLQGDGEDGRNSVRRVLGEAIVRQLNMHAA